MRQGFVPVLEQREPDQVRLPGGPQRLGRARLQRGRLGALPQPVLQLHACTAPGKAQAQGSASAGGLRLCFSAGTLRLVVPLHNMPGMPGLQTPSAAQ
jgi:hypothetical protein